jgi:protein phosphatase
MIEAIGLSHRGLIRENNEDVFRVVPELGLCVLADGMGGAQAGEKAAAIAVQSVVARVRAKPDNLNILEDAFVEADRQVRDAANSEIEFQGMGSTLVALYQVGEDVCICNAGDSRCWIWSDGGLNLITSDQTWVNEVGRSFGLRDEELESHPLRHVLTNAVGAGNSIRIQKFQWHIRPGSIALLSSDGLHGVVSSRDIGSTLAKKASLADKCQRLINLALDAGGPDNVTVVLVQF